MHPFGRTVVRRLRPRSGVAYAGRVAASTGSHRIDRASRPTDGVPRLGKRTVLVVAASALLVRILYCVFVIPGYVPSTDAAHYNDIALKVSQGHGIASQFPYIWTHATAFRPPLYPVLLGGLYAVFGEHVGVAQAFNVLLGTGVVVLATLLAFRLGGRVAALVTAVLATFHPTLLAGDGVVLTEPLALLLLLATLLALDRDRYALAGLLSGLLVLTRPSAQLFVPVVAAYLLLAAWRRGGWRSTGAGSEPRAGGFRAGMRRGLKPALVFALIAVATTLPWVVRNTVVFGKPVLVTSNGFNLAAIYSPIALQQGSFVDPVRDPRFVPILRFSQLENLDEATLDATLREQGLKGIRQEPGQVPRVVAKNVLYLSDYYWRTNDRAEALDGRNIAFRHATLPYVWLVLLLGAAGLWLMRRQRLGALVVLSAAYMTAVSLVTVAPPRLRAPLDVLCCIAVGVLIAAAVTRIRERRAAAAPVPSVDATPDAAPDASVGAGR
jgi:4-amino-4-deoxy-L-arabinose transferase-like glycosyltransferase